MIRSIVLRTRSLLVRRGPLVVTVCLVVGVLSLGGAGWLYTHPPTTQVTDHTHRQTVQSNVLTQATVAENATLYEPGRTLTNRSVYIRSDTPSATLVQMTTVPDGQAVTVSQRIVLTYRAERDETTFWRNATTIAQTETTTRSGRVRTRTRIDPREIQERMRMIDEAIGSAGSVAVDMRIVVSYATPRYDGTLEKTFDLRIEDGWYRIGAPTVSRTHSTPVSRTVAVPTRQRGTLTGLGVLGIIGVLAGLAAAVVWRSEVRRSGTDDLAFELHRQRYAEWISTGTLPDNAGETLVSVASLEDLVDIGIDTRNRVIHDPSRDRYAVIDGETVYYHDRFWNA